MKSKHNQFTMCTISLVPRPLGRGREGGEPGYKTRVLCATNNIVSSGTCFAWRMSDTTGWVVGRAVQVTRDMKNESFTGVAGDTTMAYIASLRFLA